MRYLVLLYVVSYSFAHSSIFSEEDVYLDIHKNDKTLKKYFFIYPARNCKLELKNKYYLSFLLDKDNSEIYSMHEGIAWVRDNIVSIKSKNNILIKYIELKNIQIKTGDAIKQGTIIGYSSSNKLKCRIIADDFVVNEKNLCFS